MKNLLIICSLSIILPVCNLIADNAEKENIEKAISEAVSFSAPQSEIKTAADYIASHNSPHTVKYVKLKLGANNLSSFLFGISPDDTKEYEIDTLDNGSAARLPEVLKILKEGKSLAGLKNLRDIKWKKTDENKIIGCFIYHKENLFNVKCIFQGEKQNSQWKITRLDIPARNGKNSLTVFDVKQKNTGHGTNE